MDAAVTDPGPPSYVTVPEMIAAVTSAYSGKDVIVTVDGDRLTFADVDDRAAEFAGRLLRLGVCKGVRVGLLAPTGPDWVVAALATMRIGAVLVPINTFVQADELAWFLKHADIQTLIARPSFLRHRYLDDLGRLADFGHEPGPLFAQEFPSLRHVVTVGEGDIPPWAHRDSDLPSDLDPSFLRRVESVVDPSDPAVVMYSSGSTSEPKGAIHAQSTVVRLPYEVNARRGLTETDRVFMAMPFFWVGGMHHGFLAAYGAGACMLTDETFEITRTVAALEREQATIVFCWPHQATAIRTEPTFSRRNLNSLRRGSRNMVLPADRSEDPTHWSNWLGMSETFGAHLIAPMTHLLPESAWGTSGRPVPGVEHRIVDQDTGQPKGIGEVGVLDVRGYSVMLGRVRAAREDVFDAEGWYRTGDLGFFDADGYFFFAGRGDDVIKAGGVNVSPDEVEAVLREVDGVHAAYVVGVADGPNISLVAVLVAQEGKAPDPEAARQFARERLSTYKVPSRVMVLAEEEVPMTATGKVRRRALADILMVK